jgi:hypothetical protein
MQCVNTQTHTQPTEPFLFLAKRPDPALINKVMNGRLAVRGVRLGGSGWECGDECGRGRGLRLWVSVQLVGDLIRKCVRLLIGMGSVCLGVCAIPRANPLHSFHYHVDANRRCCTCGTTSRPRASSW